MKSLETKLGYTFKNEALIAQALSHSSLPGKGHYERLEFLGDRVLNLAIADLMFEMFPDEEEGILAKRHAALVCQDALFQVAEKLDIARLIKLSPGEKRSGGHKKPSIVSDVVEALLAVIFLEAGFEEAKRIIRNYWAGLVHTVELKDAKSHLQEFLQGKGETLPTYETVEELGKAHKMTFKMRVVTVNHGSAEGTGASKQQAQQNAAKQLLIKLGERENDR